MAADMITAPPSPMALRRRPEWCAASALSNGSVLTKTSGSYGLCRMRRRGPRSL
jgi:hypothetical protein